MTMTTTISPSLLLRMFIHFQFSFTFLSRTFAYLRLVQGLSRSVSAFSSFMRKFLYQCIVANQSFQYLDDLGTAAFKFEYFLDNLTAIIESREKNWPQIQPFYVRISP